jgi:hypothetical protein
MLFSQEKEKVSIQSFITDPRRNFTNYLVKSFMIADIPLLKLRDLNLKSLFLKINFPLPSETNARRMIDELYFAELQNITEYFKFLQFFVIFDESEINNMKYCNILAEI